MDLFTFRRNIGKRVEILKAAEEEARTAVEMIHDALANDGELLELEDRMKDARRRYNLAKEALLNEPANRKQIEKLQDIRQELKDTKKLLSDELLGYVLGEQKLDFEDSQGKLHRISVTAKMKSTDQQSMF